MKKQEPTPKALNLELNKRFKVFLDAEFKTQNAMAEFLGITPKVVSYMVRGIIDVNPKYIMKLVKEKKMNRKWYDYGSGPMKTDGKEKPKSTITDINDIKANIAAMEGRISRLESRNRYLIELVERLEKALEKE